MGILNILKKKKTEKETKEVKAEIKEKEVEQKKEVPKVKPEKSQKPTGKISISFLALLKAPHITEKATDLSEKNQYIFKVDRRANKTEIKKTVEKLYGVKVLDVKMINAPRKKRHLRRISGWRKGYKKAIVKLREGQKIELMPK